MAKSFQRKKKSTKPRFTPLLFLFILILICGIFQVQNTTADVPWWDSNYTLRKIIHIRNNSSDDMPQGYTVSLVLDHASLVSAGESLSSGDDIRIIYYNRTTGKNSEIDRVAETSWNSSSTEIRFRLQNRIRSGEESRDYYLYYNNPAAGSPPADRENVYLIYDDFSGDLSKWDTASAVGDWSIDSSYYLDSAYTGSNIHYFLQQNYLSTPSNYICEWRGYSPFDGTWWNFFITIRENPSDPQQRIVVGAREGADSWTVERWTTSTDSTNLATYSEVIDRGIWYSCMIRLLGDTITFWVDGAEKINYTMSGSETGWDQVFGFANDRSHAKFDDLKLRYLVDPEPTVQLRDPWKPGAYQYRQQITITNNVSSEALPSGYSVRVDIPHATWVSAGKSQSDGDDVRILYWDGSEYVELDRVILPGKPTDKGWNQSTTRIYFATQSQIPAGGSDSNYYIYYGNSSAGAPPNDPNNVFLWYDNFSSNSVVSGGEEWANAVVYSRGVTDDFLAVGTNYTDASATISAGGELILDMGDGEEIADDVGNDFTVNISGTTNTYEVSIGNCELGPWRTIGTGTTTNSFNIAVNRIIIFSDDFETDKGWTSGGTYDDWERTAPEGRGSLEYGGPDPSSDHTTGSGNVFGNDLTGLGSKLGDYENSCDNWLRSPAIDCSGYTGVRLKFWRWLGVENRAYDEATLQVSNNGTTWTNIWTNPEEDMDDQEWVECDYDISSVADNQSTVYIRFIMKSDSGWTWCGWNIDDLEVYVLEEPSDAMARYIRIRATGSGDVAVRSVEALSRKSDVVTSGYVNGRHVDIHGTNTAVMRYDSYRQVATFDTGDNYCGGLRVSSLELENALIQVDMNTFRTYPINGTAAFLVRWSSTTTNFYTHFSAGTYTSPGIARGDLSERNTDVAAPATNTYFPSCQVDGGSGGSGDGINVQDSTATTTGGQTGYDTMRYGIYQLSSTNNCHRFWCNTDTDASALIENLNYNAGSYATSGQCAVQTAQQWGWIDNLIIRYYFYPEPSSALGGEVDFNDFKVTGIHTSTNAVSQGATDVIILRLDIETGQSDTLSEIIITSKNTNDSDIVGVSCYYTGTSTTFSKTNPFGTTGQIFSGSPGTVTFSGTQDLPANSIVHLFITYDISSSAGIGNTLDAKIAATNVTISGVGYPASLEIDPSGARTIASPQNLDSISVENIDTSDVRPGAKNAQVLRIAFTVSGTGSPLTLESLTITSANISDSDVVGVSAYYTGTSPTFSTDTPFGTTDEPFSGGSVTFTGSQDLGDGTFAGTFYIFIVYTLSSTATLGNTIDAKILAGDITIEGSTYPASDEDPSGARTIVVPTGVITALPPVSSLVDADPSMQNFTNFNNTDGADPDLYVDKLEADDGTYAGGSMSNPGAVYPQKIWLEFLFDLDEEVPGIIGSDINSLKFKAELYLTGEDNGIKPKNDPGEWDKISTALVQVYNFSQSSWEDMEEPFLSETPSEWLLTAEAAIWDEPKDENPERPLIRFRGSGFTDGHLNSDGQLKIRVMIDGRLYDTDYECNMVFDYALIDFNYGANIEQVSYRWTDEYEIWVANENRSYSTVPNVQLHLRVGIRSRYKPYGNHRLALQYDTDEDFTSGDHFDPVVMTTSTTELQYWDDARRTEGDLLESYTLTGSNASGIYHEDNVPPIQSKDQDLFYEEDFTVVPRTTGTFYLRVVEVDGFGSFSGTLEVYSNTIKLIVTDPSISMEAYAWAVNESSPTFQSANQPLEFTVGTTYILAIRIANVGDSSANYYWRLEYQRSSGTPGPWTRISTNSDEWRAVDGLYAADDSTVFTTSFVTGTGTGTAINGKYSEVGTVRSELNPWNLGEGFYTELWYSIQPTSLTANNAYRFRITNKGSTAGWEYVEIAIAQQTIHEQVSYRIADEDENSLASENTSCQVSKDQLLHLRVGIRSNNADWNNHYLGLQFDTSSLFSSPVLMTPSSSPGKMWDDGDHANGDPVSGTKLLSGDPFDGIYHESNVLPSAQSKIADTLYEEDFTMSFDSVGTYYIRVVEVDSSGNFVDTLDKYTELITIKVVEPSLRQNFYNWAEDATSPSFQGTDFELELVTGQDYILAIQAENVAGVGDAPWWDSAYAKRKQIMITNNASSTLPDGYSVKITIDHASLVSAGEALSSGDDLRIVYYDGANNIELDRSCESSWNSSSCEIWFKTQATIPAGESDGNYYMYYSNSSAGSPPANRRNVYLFYDDFSGDLSQWSTYSGSWAINASDELEGTDVGAGDFVILQNAVSIPGDRIIEFRGNAKSGGDTTNFFVVTLQDSTSGDFIAVGGREGSDYWRIEQWDVDADTASTLAQNPETIAVDTWYTLRVVILGNNHKLYVGGDLKLDYDVSVSWDPVVGCATFNANGLFDDVKVRRYISPEPTVTVGGSPASVTWQLQFQKISGTPGNWTNVTTTSTEWQAVDGVYGVDEQTIATSDFVCNSGNPPAGAGTDPVSGLYSEKGYISMTLPASSYTEFWFCIRPTVEAGGNKYQFRLTNAGNSGPFTYSIYPIARETVTEQVSFRWTDSSENVLAGENSGYDATVNELLHLRVGVRANNGDLGTHYLGLQYDTDINFPAPVLVTTSSSNICFWDDPDHVEGDTVSTLVLTGSTAGIYHEDNIPPSQTKSADTLYEEDFTVKILSTGTFYLRVVQVDSFGEFLQALDSYSEVISITGNDPYVSQDANNWADDGVSPVFGTINQSKEITPGSTYILAIRIYNAGVVAASFDWQLQYQKISGTPGGWTNVTTTSTEWQAVDGSGTTDGASVATGDFVTGAADANSVAGRESETGNHSGFSLPAGANTELRYAIMATSGAYGNAYQFRVTNSGSTAGFTYDIYPRAQDTTHEQVSFRWADSAESPLEAENTSYDAAVDQLLHLRIGIRSNNSGWTGHYLALQYDTVSDFSNANAAPSSYLVTTTSSPVAYWDDSDHVDGDVVTSFLLSGSPSAGVYHESNVTTSEDKDADTLYEEDFTVKIDTAGTYYLRVVEVDSSGNYVGTLDIYTEVAQVVASVPNVAQRGYNWAENEGTPAWQSADTILEFDTLTTYILAVRVKNVGTSPSTFNWRLQYQEDPTGNPGPWTDITTTSSIWRAVDGIYGNDGMAVPTTSFSTGSETGTAIDGVYSETGVVSSFTLGAGEYTELWYSIQPQSDAELKRYQFRLTNDGAAGSFTFDIYPQAAQRVKEQVSYRWTDENEAAVAGENSNYNAIVNERLHLRVGIRSKHLNWGAHYLGLQYADNIDFVGATLVTTSSSVINMWDDADRAEGDAVVGLILSGSPSAGIYHEDEIPPSQTKSADTLYEEDFTIQITTTGTYYLRVVELDSSGNFVGTLDSYDVTISLTGNNPSTSQDAYNWGDGELTGATGFGTQDMIKEIVPGQTYTLAIRVSNVGAVTSSYDWRLQYQKISGTPGAWTDITTTSADWKAVSGGTVQDGSAIATSDFVTGAADIDSVAGRYSETGAHDGYSLAAGANTELRFEIQPQSTTFGNKYQFRLTNSGSTSGFTYNIYPEAKDTTHEQVSFRWTDTNENALAPENNSFTAAVDQELHLRVGIRSNNSDWTGHYLALQYDTVSDFSNADAAPSSYLVTTTSSPIAYWDDPDHLNGDALTSFLLSGSPSAGVYHESNVSVSQDKTTDVLYEEDFTVKIDTAGTYYLRVVEVDSSGNYVGTLDDYSVVIEISAEVPNVLQEAYEWTQNSATPDWSGPSNTILEFDSLTTYILAVRVYNDGASPSTFNWRLEYQKDPTGSPGPWIQITPTSTDWIAADGDYGADGDVITTSSFVTGTGTGTAVDGVYCEDGVVSGFTLGAGEYTELWYSIQPQSSAELNRFRFRITDDGSAGSFVYNIYPHAAQRVKEQVSWRWADSDEIAVAAEDTVYLAATGEELHLRVAIRSKHLDWTGHNLGLQYDTDIGFTAPVLVTTTSADIQYWDDPDHADGDDMTGTKILTDTTANGIYHEDEDQPASQDKSADTLYEEDFAIKILSVGTFYLRVVQVDEAGANPSVLDSYGTVIEIQGGTPSNDQTAYNWADDQATLSWKGDNEPLYFTPGNKYIIALRIYHDAPNADYTWQLQYQRDPYGTPGPWTTITTTSVDWQAVAPTNYTAKVDGDVVSSTEVASDTDGTMSVSTRTAVDGRFDSSGGESFLLTGDGVYTEFWFSITPTASSDGYEYRFRLTNSGSSSGFTYTVYAEATNFKKIEAGNWGTDGNWTPSGVPSSTENAKVVGDVTMDVTSGNAKLVVIGGSTGTLTIASGNTLTATNGITIRNGGTLRITTTGSVVISNNSISVESGGVLELGSDGELRIAASNSLSVDGTLRSSGSARITRSGASGSINVVINGSVDITGLNFSYGDLEGLEITSSATIQNLRGITFTDVNSASGARHLSISKATLNLNAPGIYFDTLASGQYNVRLYDTDGGGDVILNLESRDDATNGPGRGEAYESEVNGAIINWVYTAQADTKGELVGFPTAAFDWNTWEYYSTYVAMKDIDAANTDRIYVLDENGDLKGYYFDVDSADGDIVNFPLWDTELDTLDEDGDSLTDDYIHVLYIATSSGKIIKVIDTGSSFLTPASGTPWETSFSSTDVSEITSPLISDGTNIYFGGMDESSNPKIFGLEIDTKTLIMEVSAASVVRAAPSWVKDGQTYLYTGSDESAGQAHIYRVDVPDALAVKDNTSALHDVVAATTVMNERLHVGDLGGRMHGIDALSTDFVNLSGFPYRDTINHTVAELDAGTKGIYAAVYMSFYTNKIYYGDADGHFYVLNPDGTPQSGYPIQPAGTAKIGSAAIFKNGVIYFGNDDGKFIIVDESTASTIKTYDFGSGVKIGDVAYFYDNALFMIGTSTGKVFYIPREDDPTP